MPFILSPTQVAFNARGDGRFNKPFQAQLDFFRQKENIPTEHYDSILKSAHDRGFMVAGAMKADLLNDFRIAVDKVIAEGKSIEWFRSQFDKIVADHGWDYNGSRDWRSRIIYKQNMLSSYAAGRWQQLNDPKLLASRPYWEYHHNDTVTNPRKLHESWDGLILRYDDPWWLTHFTPNGWGCRCYVSAVRADKFKGDVAPDNGSYTKVDRWGEVHTIPNGIDYGFDYAPSASLGRDFVANKAATLPEPLANAFKADMATLDRVTQSVSSALKLPRSGVAKEAANIALPAIDNLHIIDTLPVIPVKNSKNKSFMGNYSFYLGGNAIDIKISDQSVHPPLSLIHEIGHFIDNQALGGELGVHESIGSPIMEQWRNAVNQSMATTKLQKLLVEPRYKKKAVYYLSTHEQWARSYAQWVTLRSQDKTLLEQLNKIRLGVNPTYAASQWDDADFEPVAAAIDELFKALGWLK